MSTQNDLLEPVDNIEVEIVDDTPEADRGRKPLPYDALDDAHSSVDNELPEKTRKRINELTKAAHDARREKEQALREHNEAIAYAKAKHDETMALRAKYAEGEKLFVANVRQNLGTHLQQAEQEIQAAYEAGDAKRMAQATAAMADISARKQQVEQYQPPAAKIEQFPQQPVKPQPTPQVQEWMERNPWFSRDQGMTQQAYLTHERLVREGVQPDTQEYYARIDKTMRAVYPEKFAEEGGTVVNTVASVPVASGRSAAAGPTPTKVRLTDSQVKLCTSLGITPQQYAAEMLRLNRANN